MIHLKKIVQVNNNNTVIICSWKINFNLFFENFADSVVLKECNIIKKFLKKYLQILSSMAV